VIATVPVWIRVDLHSGSLPSLAGGLRTGRTGRARCEAAQDQLGDALGELFVDRAAGDDEPVEERPAEHVEGELEVEIGAQVAAIDPAAENLGQRGPAAGQEPAANGPRQVRPAGPWR